MSTLHCSLNQGSIEVNHSPNILTDIFLVKQHHMKESNLESSKSPLPISAFTRYDYIKLSEIYRRIFQSYVFVVYQKI